MVERIFTIGHSNHPFGHFESLLRQHGIEALVDIRRFPGSRKHPHFSRENLLSELAKAGIEYFWFESLGGRREKSRDDSPNLGLHNESFRNYADYMLTQEFQESIEKLRAAARAKTTVIMCAEALFWQCHRRLVSDFLIAQSVTVEHIMPSGALRLHTVTAGAVIANGSVSYPENTLFG